MKFDHNERKGNCEERCVNCGGGHKNICHEPVKCVNCQGEHKADYMQYPERVKEEEFLNFKRHLPFTEVRR